MIKDYGKIKPNIRRLYDMENVIYDLEWLSKMENIEIYYMYRELSLSEKDKIAMKDLGLRYDITVIPPRMLGCEYVKTQGHYHPKMPGFDISYPEIYEVLSGEGYFLMQKGINKIDDVILVKANISDKVIIPPDYGHVTINPSHKLLKTANWIGNFVSIYAPIKEKRGAAYFILKNKIVKNINYGDLPEIRTLDPIEIPEIGVQKNRELYDLINDSKMLEFLIKPSKYAWLFNKFMV